MKSNVNTDWFDELKIEVIRLVMLFHKIQETAVFMLHNHAWILEDIHLCESFSHFQEMTNVSNQDLNTLVQKIYDLDHCGILFDKDDLLDEFAYIQENVHLESGYLTNMVNYISIIINPSIPDLQMIERLEQYQEINISCYNQMKINNEQLKSLRKERRD